jgi:hypothetical protein
VYHLIDLGIYEIIIEELEANLFDVNDVCQRISSPLPLPFII